MDRGTPKQFISRLINLPSRVTREFDIVDENVVDVGIRLGLINKSVDYNLSIRASNLPDNRVRVIINRDSDSINEFLDVIQKDDIRIKQITPKTYSLSELREYQPIGTEMSSASWQSRCIRLPGSK